ETGLECLVASAALALARAEADPIRRSASRPRRAVDAVVVPEEAGERPHLRRQHRRDRLVLEERVPIAGARGGRDLAGDEAAAVRSHQLIERVPQKLLGQTEEEVGQSLVRRVLAAMVPGQD